MHNKIIGEWKSQLNEKSKEFESLKGQIMTAKDVKMLRIKLAEEFEETKKKKWAVLQEDVARFSGLYYSLRQQYEELKMEMEKQVRKCTS
ncbi:hypothetical protein BKA69DRAFT_350982 [Paraphysoderma sedebokerense]|nr:hypothetical protein BKA69DRAFT_350982 [Paraphysoderma sedebokerense]